MTKYLLASDGSKCSVKAAQYVIDMTRDLPEVKVTLLYVSYMTPAYADGLIPFPLHTLPEYNVEEEAEKALQPVTNLFNRAGIHYTTKVRDGYPAMEIIAEAQEGGYDLLIVGSHGYDTIDRMVLGSVSERVAEEAVCPVLVVK